MIEIQGVDYIRVPATDIGESTRFYGEILGLPAGPTQHEDWVEYQPQANSIVLLQVDDVAAARTDLEAKGVAFDGETFDTGVCHMANFTDPDGNPLTLHKRYAPYEERSE